MTTLRLRYTTLALALAAVVPMSGMAQQSDARLRGAWETDQYRLKDGTIHQVRGRIFFDESEWTVLFFVVDDDGQPQRGSAEGGTYHLRGDSLIFTHHYHLSSGRVVDGLAAAPLRMTVQEDNPDQPERCSIILDQDALTIFFPSGNAMTFHRLST